MEEKKLTIPLNRVEGDLEVILSIDKNNFVTNSWVKGTMYRGFEQILIKKEYKSGLVYTPRICGICGTAHLYAAVNALEDALQCCVPKNAIRIRNICLMSEEVQSDCRHTLLMFLIDLCNEKYKNNKYFSLINEYFKPLTGKYYKEAIHYTKKLLEIIAIFGGQWPHSHYMIPGGVTFYPNKKSIITCIQILDEYIRWYEESILGCSLEEWNNSKTINDFQNWINQNQKRKNSVLGLFTRMGRDIKLHKLGVVESNFLHYGSYLDSEKYQPGIDRATIRKGGFYKAKEKEINEFNEFKIKEHLKYSFYKAETNEKDIHPSEKRTIPFFQKDSHQYSWVTAPRYDNFVVEVGPLAELIIDEDPLITDFYRKEKSNVWLRQFSRIQRPAKTLILLKKELNQLLKDFKEDYYIPINESKDHFKGTGFINAARGALAHWIEFEDCKIKKYQIITPTNWNASPRDNYDILGHWEQSFIGTHIESLENPLEIGHIVRSHDACLVCSVHFLEKEKFNFKVLI